MDDATPSECAMTYALWDSENSVRLERPEDFDTYLRRARSVMEWLRVHGARVQYGPWSTHSAASTDAVLTKA